MNESDKPDTPEFMFNFLMKKFKEKIPPNPRVTREDAPQDRSERLALLADYANGNPPLPYVAPQYRDSFSEVLRKARTNLASLCVEAMSTRSRISFVSSKADENVDGDDLAAKLHRLTAFKAVHADLNEFVWTYGEGYLTVLPYIAPEGQSAEFGGGVLDGDEDANLGPAPRLRAEDPRFCVSYLDPLDPNRCMAFLKKWTDPLLDQDVAMLMYMGQVFWARREEGQHNDQFNLEEWDWSKLSTENTLTVSGLEPLGGIPVVPFINKGGLGEFEKHLDLLDRIMDGILQRIVIMWYQSFKQRAVIGDLDEGEDFTEEESIIQSLRDGQGEGAKQLEDLFKADPGALWAVPEGVQFWESTQADITGNLKSVLDDIREFAASTSTPLYMLAPDGQNQSASGAELSREGLQNKILDRQERMTPGLIAAHQMAFILWEQVDHALDLTIHWKRPAGYQLSEKADATPKVKGVLSNGTILREIWEFDQDQIRLNEAELIQEAMNADPFGQANGLGPAPDEPTDPSAGPAPESVPADTPELIDATAS